MINKLRKKIFLIIQLSLTVIIIGIITIFIGFSYRNTITSSTMFIDRIEEKGEIGKERLNEFYEIDEPNEANEFNGHNELRFDNDPFLINVEGTYKFEVNNNSIIRESDDVTDEIRDYAIKISNKNQEDGYIGNYIYKIRRVGNNGKEITLIENEKAINRFKITVISAIFIGIISILCVYIIAKKIAKTIVKPVEQSFEKQKQFISDASHELKTPLAVIEANADVLQNKVGESKWLLYIQNEVQSMDKLVNDLLTLSRIENTNELNSQRFDLSKEIQMSVAGFESMIYERKILLETNISEGILFNGDKEDIKHIVSIIIDNAIKHTKENCKIIVNVLKEKMILK